MQAATKAFISKSSSVEMTDESSIRKARTRQSNKALGVPIGELALTTYPMRVELRRASVPHANPCTDSTQKRILHHQCLTRRRRGDQGCAMFQN